MHFNKKMLKNQGFCCRRRYMAEMPAQKSPQAAKKTKKCFPVKQKSTKHHVEAAAILS
jgi:hypothetical protein